MTDQFGKMELEAIRKMAEWYLEDDEERVADAPSNEVLAHILVEEVRDRAEAALKVYASPAWADSPGWGPEVRSRRQRDLEQGEGRVAKQTSGPASRSSTGRTGRLRDAR